MSYCTRSWGGLLDSIRTGKTAAQLAGIDNSFDLMAHDPARAQLFDEGMVALTRQVIPAVLAAYDFSTISRLIDVGGGYGELLCAILKACPSLRGAIFDLPRCAEGAKRQLTDAGLSDRGEFISGSFFESVPSGADAVIMKSIIHDWDDERSVKILQNCRRALAAGGKLLLVERIMPETTRGKRGALLGHAERPQHAARPRRFRTNRARVSRALEQERLQG